MTNNNDYAIVAFKHPQVGQWDPDSVKSGIPGSEEAIINVASILAKLGNKVTVYANPPKDSKYFDTNPKYVDVSLFGNTKHENIIAWRQHNFSILAKYGKKVYFWAHDIPIEPIPIDDLKCLSGCLFVSKYQRELFVKMNISMINIPYVICGNGIDLTHFYEPFKHKRNPFSCAYISNYSRGLTYLLDIWIIIKKKFPEATLDIYFGRQTLGAINEQELNKIVTKIEALKNEGVNEIGKVGHNHLANSLKRTSILAYPCITDTETYCISVVKAQAAGCIPVTTRIAALDETVHPDAPCINQINTEQDLMKYCDILMTTMEKAKDLDRQKYIDFAKNHTWDICVNKMLSLINPDISVKTIQLVMIIKNGSRTIEETLRSYRNIVDEYTILDTGSIDGTQDIIRKTLSGKKFNLIEEKFSKPFKFDVARNRALDLSNQNTTYTIMPDDSYAIMGENIREQILLGNKDYYHIDVISNDGSQKRSLVWKTEHNLRYDYPVHESIEFGKLSYGGLNGYMKDKMNKIRTNERLVDDYTLISEYCKKNPTCTRMWFYLGQTCSLQHKWQEAFDSYTRYFDHDSGFIEEKFNALYRRALIAEFNLKKPWYEVLPLYIQAYDLMPSRAEPIFSIAEYYINVNPAAGFMYIKWATEIDMPEVYNSFDPHTYTYHIPRLYAKYCILLNRSGGFEHAKRAYKVAINEKNNEWIKEMETIMLKLINN